MDKNAFKDTGKFFYSFWRDIMVVIIPVLIGWLAKLFTHINPFVAGFLAILIVLAVIHLFNEIRWKIKRDRGIVIISPRSDEKLPNEKEKSIWINNSSKNEFDKLNFDVIIKRMTLDDNIMGSDLAIEENTCIIKDFEVERLPRKITIASGAENIVWVYLDGEKKMRMDVLLPFEEVYLKDSYEIVFEINGKINSEYIFSELYKIDFSYVCTKEPNIFVGQNESHRMCAIDLIDFRSWSEKQEKNRLTLRKNNIEKQRLLILGT